MQSTRTTILRDFKITSLGIQKMEIQTSSFKTVFEYEYQKHSFWKLCQFHIRTLAVLSSYTTDMTYTIRIVNINTNQVIGSNTFTSTDYYENIVTIDNNVNFSSNQSLEIQVKTDTPGTLSLLSAHIREENEA
jgi:hypothetical protein